MPSVPAIGGDQRFDRDEFTRPFDHPRINQRSLMRNVISKPANSFHRKVWDEFKSILSIIISNHENALVDALAECKASTFIWRRVGDVELNTYALSDFRRREEADGWKILAVKEEGPWSEGNVCLHSGVKRDQYDGQLIAK